MDTFAELFEDSFPKITNAQEANDFLKTLDYKGNNYKALLHLFNSFKNVRSYLKKPRMKYSKGKNNYFIGKEQGGEERRYAIDLSELAGGHMTITRQEEPKQKVEDFKHYEAFKFDELF